MPIRAAKGLGLLDVFVEHHAPWHVDAVLQFIRAQPHDGVLDRGNFQPWTIEVRLDQRIELGGSIHATAKQRVVMHGISFGEALQIAGELINVITRLLTD